MLTENLPFFVLATLTISSLPFPVQDTRSPAFTSTLVFAASRQFTRT